MSGPDIADDTKETSRVREYLRGEATALDERLSVDNHATLYGPCEHAVTDKRNEWIYRCGDILCGVRAFLSPKPQTRGSNH